MFRNYTVRTMYDTQYQLTDTAILRNVVGGLNLVTSTVEEKASRYRITIDKYRIIKADVLFLSEDDAEGIVLRAYTVRDGMWRMFKRYVGSMVTGEMIPSFCKSVEVEGRTEDTLRYEQLYLVESSVADFTLLLTIYHTAPGYLNPLQSTLRVRQFTLNVDANTPLYCLLENNEECLFVRPREDGRYNYPYHMLIETVYFSIRNTSGEIIVNGDNLVMLKNKVSRIDFRLRGGIYVE